VPIVEDDKVTATGTVSYRRLHDSNYSGWMMTTDDTLIFNGPPVISALTDALTLDHDYSIKIEAGPPGCGKTYAIIHSYVEGDAVSCPVRQSVEDTRRELASVLGRTVASLKTNVRTIDSYMVNRATRPLRATKLFADECFMTHAGKWYAMAALIGARELVAYGDPYQIPHIPRAKVPALYVRLQGEVNWSYLTRRCPPNLVATWSHIYGHRVRTTVQDGGTVSWIKADKHPDPPRGCVMMCMYQADKKLLQAYYKGMNVVIMTTHESQGKTFDHVCLHNPEKRLRPRGDPYYLFESARHVLVAMSRSRQSFWYCKASQNPDDVTDWLPAADNPRAVDAMRAVDTVGEPAQI